MEKCHNTLAFNLAAHERVYTHTHLVGAEADVAQLQDGGEDGPDGGDLVAMETDGLKAADQQLEILLVLLAPQVTRTALGVQGKRRGVMKKEERRG